MDERNLCVNIKDANKVYGDRYSSFHVLNRLTRTTKRDNEDVLKMDKHILCVNIKDAYKVYGDRYSNFHVLNGLTLTLPQGTIYGLLGPSGCGKTTLLRCIMGGLRLDAGYISVFGNFPGFEGSTSLIGYMPQETALVDNLTVFEMLHLYGNIYGMDEKTIETRSLFLIQLLNIPSRQKRLICQMSGGQKRRVSVAVAILHNPELLILDEPTVGVEPILRKNIWDHLLSLVESNNTTIILTTHYIEEARMANNVGLMLNGRLLAEAPPEALIAQHGCETLEHVFLKLCLNSDMGDTNFSKTESKKILKRRKLETIKSEISTHEVLPIRRKLQNYKHTQSIKALLRKNILIFLRSPTTVMFQIFLPTLVLLLLAFSIGKPLTYLPIAVVDKDIDGFGDLFLNKLNSRTLIQVSHDNYQEAQQSVIDGAAVAAIYIPLNFTQSITARYQSWIFADDIAINDSIITIYMKDTNGLTSITVFEELHVAFFKFIEDVFANKWGMNPMLVKIPVQSHDKQLHGARQVTFDQYIIPGFLICAVFLVDVGCTFIASYCEKRSGNYQRAILTGVTFVDSTLSDILAQFAVMFAQMPLMVLTAIFVCGITCEGSYVLVSALILFEGLCACCFGVFMSYCAEPVAGVAMLLGYFLVALCTEGIFFPQESLPVYLRHIVEFGILKYPIEANRDVMNRGWGLTYTPVLLGFVVPVVWSLIFILASHILFRIRK